MRALVTGASGFIGGALTAALLEQGWQVHALVRPVSLGRLAHSIIGGSGSDPLLASSQLHLFPGDLNCACKEPKCVDRLARAAEGCQVVFHAAAIRDRWGTSFNSYYEANVTGTQRLLQATLGRVRRFVYISSVGVFGHPETLGIDESFPTVLHRGLRPGSGKAGYHLTKAMAERLVLARRAEIEAVVVRPTITYGPGDRDGMLTRLIGMLQAGHFVRVGAGRNYIHLTYIADLLHGLFLAGTHPDAAGETFILSGPQPVRVVDLLAQLEALLGRRSLAGRVWVPERLARPLAAGLEELFRAGVALHALPDGVTPPLTVDKIDTLCRQRSFLAGRAQQVLGYLPRWNLAEGLRQTLDWLAGAGSTSETGWAAPVPRHAEGV